MPVITSVCSVSDASAMLGLPLSTAQRWARLGRLPVVAKMTGGTGAYVLDRTAVEAMAAERAR
ncbi:helix-turn-helix domain-containing protein [Tsukamurella paurometabola]|nr:helix-turn-helix domain-containing protein [Tsukamurella paurometabola]